MAQIFQTLTSDDYILSQQEVVTSTVWSDGSTTMTTFFTSCNYYSCPLLIN